MGALSIIGTVFKIILWILAGLLGLLILLLILPIFYSIGGEGCKDKEHAAGSGSGKIFLLFGFVYVKILFPSEHPVILKILGIPVYKLTPGREKPEKEKPKQETQKEETQTPSVSVKDKIKAVIRILQMDASKEALHRGRIRILRIVKHILPRRMKGHFRFGMDDPADTGYILGGLSALFSFLPWKVSLYPEFEREILEGSGKGSGHVVPLLLIIYSVQILTDRYIRGFIRRIRKGLKYGR
ncbi:MAG: DUF2953 domain-containing protein [Lachnospiraceae bacterium]|nr:DUF2953 domain-containing protein [Lachnospiraceae bacterium]